MSDTCPFERIRDETLAQVKEMMDAVERRHGYEFFDRVLAEAYAKALADKAKAEAQVAMLRSGVVPELLEFRNYLEQLRKVAEAPAPGPQVVQTCYGYKTAAK